MPVIINKTTDSPKQPANKTVSSRKKDLSPAAIAAIVGIVLVIIGGVYFFLMRGPTVGPDESAAASQGDGYGVPAPPVVGGGAPTEQNLPDNSNISKESGGPVTVPGK